MWSKFNKTLSKFIKNTDEQSQETSPTQLIEITIQELEEAIIKTQTSLTQTSDNQQNIRQKLQEYQTKSSQLYNEAVTATKNQQEALAQELIRKKNLADKQVGQYEVLYTNVSNTVYQFESQIAKMRMKIEELRSKEVVLKAKLENAQTQKELGTYLTELNQNTDLEAFEDEINEIELEAKLVNDLQSLDDEEFEQLNNQTSLSNLKNDIAAEEEKIQKQREENRFKKINKIFEQNSTKEQQLSQNQQKSYKAKKQALLQALMQQQAPPVENKKVDLNSFFDSQDVNNTSPSGSHNNVSKSRQILEDFAQHSNNIPTGSSSDAPNIANKKELFDSFFSNDGSKPTAEEKPAEEDETKSANQKKIDDFFND